MALQIGGNPASAMDSLKLALALDHLPSASIYFSPGYNSPLFSRIPFVFTVHDLNHIDRPENSNPLKLLYYSIILKRACHRAACVLTVSEYSRKRILEWSGVTPEQVVNVGNGVNARFAPGVTPYAPGFPYLLCIGNRKRHKNELRVIDAFEAAKLPREIKLIFSGNANPELLTRIGERALNDRVIFAGVISETELPAYYAGAQGLVFPSLYEGFGLPVIEAMACGTPTITSNTTALPEVAGNAALLVNPESVDQIAEAMQRLIHDRELRQELIRRGYQQAKNFTWDVAAAKISDVLQRISKESTLMGANQHSQIQS